MNFAKIIMDNYIVATIKPWNVAMFKKKICHYPGNWFLISDPKKLTPELIKEIKPSYIFFPHWSWIVPEEILSLAECVCFHETDLPYGRGGSPIQNLIIRGHRKTMISAIRMEKGIDTGPVYFKKPTSLVGSAQEIFTRNAEIVAGMIFNFIKDRPVPKPQNGRAVIFKRRTPDQGNIAYFLGASLNKVYNLIRMLDAETYPKAFLEIAGFRFEFAQAKKIKNKIIASAEIIKIFK